MILPRTLTTIFNNETNENADVDTHGETELSDEDRAFILAKGREAANPGNAAENRFFDSAQP